MSTTTPPTASTVEEGKSSSREWPRRKYTPRHSSWPYTTRDFARQDPSPDDGFYSTPRYVTHIDDHAISVLREYYEESLPKRGRVLDLCSSWISHFPPSLEALATSASQALSKSALGSSKIEKQPALQVIGLGMNDAELQANPILSHRVLQDLNKDPLLPDDPHLQDLDAVTCVVSIDYLIHPRETLESCLGNTRPGGRAHLIISNRCFPTKAVRRWLEVDEEERLGMVGDYLHFAGYRDIEIVTLSEGGGGYWNHVDPLWVVTGVKPSP